MNKNEFMEGIHILQNNYNQKFSTEKLRLFYKHLKNMNKETYLNRINEIIKSSAYMPNIAEILNAKEKISNYQGRDYSNFNFNSLLANKDIFIIER